MIKFDIAPECYKCICRVCGQLGCPHRTRKVKRCMLCLERNKRSPILDCMNFYRKEFPRFRVKRVYKIPDIRYVDKTNADDIRVMLSEILELLRSGESPRQDVNCIKNDCLCLHCSFFSSCKERCALCRDFKGQRPIKMCALKMQRERWK